MEWLNELFRDPASAAHTVLIISLVATTGLIVGSIRVFGINLGVAGVLFAGLVFGHYQFKLDETVMDFAREFGLIIFVYTIGLQVGPGFLASFRRQGLPLNLMAAVIVLLGAILTIVLAGSMGLEIPVAVGIFSGATTSTPSLAAAQQAIRQVPHQPGDLSGPGLGYAVAYPFGVIGIILSMIAVRSLFKIDLKREAEALSQSQDGSGSGLATVNLVVRNPQIQGARIKDLPIVGEHNVVISRILKGEHLEVARPETTLDVSDIVLAVGPKERLEQLKLIIGNESSVDLRLIPSNITTRRIVITQPKALGKTIPELDLVRRYGVNITRVSRAEIDFAPTPQFRTQFADTVMAVGDSAAIEQVARELGNSLKQLNSPRLAPIFLGLALGIFLGSMPVRVPGVPAPVTLGLAGGPLLAAIVLSRIGRIGPLIWYMPISANFMLRQLGIVLFLACVGLRAGDRFIPTLLGGSGLLWVCTGALITLVPLLGVAVAARFFFKLNYLTLCGLMAGSTTDTAALAFATQMANSDAPSVSYSTVYPLVMLLRVICAQAMVLFFMPYL